MEHRYPLEEEDEDEDDYDYMEEVQCGHCGQGVHPDEEQIQLDDFHKEEEEALMGEVSIKHEYPTYTPPQIANVKSEAKFTVVCTT